MATPKDRVEEWQVEHVRVRVRIDQDETDGCIRVLIESDSSVIIQDHVHVILRNDKWGATPTGWRTFENTRSFTLKED